MPLVAITDSALFCDPSIDSDLTMDAKLQDLPIDERIRLVEDLWDSIAAEQKALPLTPEQKAELDRRLDAYAVDGNRGRLAADVIADIRRRLSFTAVGIRSAGGKGPHASLDGVGT